MKTNKSQLIKLGIFVLFGLAIFILSVYFIGNKQNLFGKTTTIVSVFKNVNGLQEGNNVRFAGVDVGTVKRISINNDSTVFVDMYIQTSSIKFIKKNSLATVGTDGLVGSMIVNILPPTTGTDLPLEAGDTISSISQIATASMLATLNTTNENAALLTADLLKITNALNKGDGVLGRLINDKEMAMDLQISLSNIKKTSQATSRTIEDINIKLSQLNLNDGIAGLLLTDTLAKSRVLNIIENLDHSATQIDSITKRINQFSKDLENGDGVISYALKDTALVNHIETSIRNVEEASFTFKENMEALKHNILFRGYFRKLERQQQREKKNSD